MLNITDLDQILDFVDYKIGNDNVMRLMSANAS